MASKPTVTLTLAGDADSLAREGKRADQVLVGVGESAGRAGKQLADAGDRSSRLVTGMGHLGSAVTGAGDALDTVGGSLQAVVDLQQSGATRTDRLTRALLDVQQAQEDFNQALRDGRQAGLDSGQAAIDLEQANLDAEIALKDYNKAVKEHGADSDEARQAALDLKQAQQDVAQANEDNEQATRDAAQATIDAKTAQQDLTEANRESKPPELSKWAEMLTLITPLLSGVVGVVGLATGAQWLWNASIFASPITWIIIGIVALVAAIVLIATKTDWFQKVWSVAWDRIGKVAGAAASWVTDAWNAALNWVVDKINWVITKINGLIGALNKLPGVSIPSIPTIGGSGGGSSGGGGAPMRAMHGGGLVPGLPSQETLMLLRGGERVSTGMPEPAGLRVAFAGNTDSAFATAFMALVRTGVIQLEAT